MDDILWGVPHDKARAIRERERIEPVNKCSVGGHVPVDVTTFTSRMWTYWCKYCPAIGYGELR